MTTYDPRSRQGVGREQATMTRRKTLPLLMIAVAITACGASTAQADNGSTSEKIADSGQYGTYLDHYRVDGKTVACIVVNKNQSASVSCDWNAK